MREQIKRELNNTWDRIAFDIIGEEGNEVSGDEVRDVARDQFFMTCENEDVREFWRNMSYKEQEKILVEVFSDDCYSW